MPDVKGRLREQVLRRAGWTCEYCRFLERYSPDPLSVEHIVPRSQGGSEVVPLFHPRRQRWRDHFAWSLDAARVVGITSTGRATVELLRLNREGLVNMRQVLRKEGIHPPPEVGED
ncbi:MAG TPA: HNH endonuclease [Thermoanaerobaculia bacterium]|nr:HNH endonuclease [Thermoanaerobaculia bacterium]